MQTYLSSLPFIELNVSNLSYLFEEIYSRRSSQIDNKSDIRISLDIS